MPIIPPPHGAVYIPTHAWNAWQMWSQYEPATIERDFSYAARLHLDALRIFLSWEAWLDQPERVEACWEHCFATAAGWGLRVLPVVFEGCGREPTQENRRDTDPGTAVCVCSPGLSIVQDPGRWDGPLEFAERFLELHGSDPRLLAIEWMNEPEMIGFDKDLPPDRQPAAREAGLVFARALLRAMQPGKRSVPYAVGTSFQATALHFLDCDLDAWQWHDNFPTRPGPFRQGIEDALMLQRVTGKSVWLGEWQRLRPGGPGWGATPVAPDEIPPALHTLAPIVLGSGIGHFFWSLMLKPAYLPSQRPKGTFNGIFHPDGSVYSLADARAIARDANLVLPERAAPLSVAVEQ